MIGSGLHSVADHIHLLFDIFIISPHIVSRDGCDPSNAGSHGIFGYDLKHSDIAGMGYVGTTTKFL